MYDLRYKPCRQDGLDRNLTILNIADYEAGVGHKGLIVPCNFKWCGQCKTRKEVTMPIMDAKGVELKREPGALSLRLAAVYRKADQGLQDFMEELKALTPQDKEDFRKWFEDAGYPVK